MSEVLFGQSYFLRFDPKLWSAQQPYAPLGTLYAAAVTRAVGFDVALFDAMMAESDEAWQAALDRHAPRVAVLFEDSFNYLSKMCLLRMREAGQRMAAAAHRRGCTTIVAGSDASDHPERYLDAGADFVIVGEGEVTLPELLESLSGRRPSSPADIPGLCYRGTDGGLMRTPSRQPLRTLDALPRPAWDLVDVAAYRRVWLERHGYFSMNVATTRGCPYHCNWCAKPIYGQRYAVRSPEEVAREIAWLDANWSPDHLWMTDDVFGLKPGWIEAFADAVATHGCAKPFKCLLRADLVTPRNVPALARAGCRTVWLGAESGSQRILDAMEKGTRVEQIHEATGLLRAAGIEVAFFLQFGYPGETREDVDRTLQMVRDCRPDDIGISVSYPLPGTRFYERVKSELGAKRNWDDSDDLAMMYRGPFTTDFYRQLHRVVHKEFRGRRAARALLGGSGQRRSPNRRLRDAVSLAANFATLPLARWRLDRLSRRSHGDIGPLAPGLTQEAAARPSRQE